MGGVRGDSLVIVTSIHAVGVEDLGACSGEVVVSARANIGHRQQAHDLSENRADAVRRDNVIGKLSSPHPIRAAGSGIIYRISGRYRAKISTTERSRGHAANPPAALNGSLELVVPKDEHLILFDGAARGNVALIPVVIRHTNSLSVGARSGDFLGQRVRGERRAVAVEP